MRNLLPRLALAALAVTGLAVTAGCQALGAAAAAMPPPTVEPAYDGLAGRSVAVVVWCEPQIELDYPSLPAQVGRRVESNLLAARDQGGKRARRALEGATVPYPAESFVGYLKEDPSLSMIPAAELAALAGAERVIYVEIEDFTTRGGAAQGLVRGVADVNLTVFEVDEPITRVEQATPTQGLAVAPPAREAYREDAIRVVYPPKGPAEGSMNLQPRAAYSGLVAEAGDALSKRFVPYTADEF